MANQLVSLNSKDLELIRRALEAAIIISPISIRDDYKLLFKRIENEKSEFDNIFPDQKWEY